MAITLSMTKADFEPLADDDSKRTVMCMMLLNLMRDAGIDQCEVRYNGSGDSPQDADTHFMMYDAAKKEAGDFPWVTHQEAEEAFENAGLRQMIGEFVFQLSFDQWGGWYNNDGGHGTCTFHVNDPSHEGDTPFQPRVEIELYSYHTEETLEGTHTYSAE